jgi:hypothetical protein
MCTTGRADLTGHYRNISDASEVKDTTVLAGPNRLVFNFRADLTLPLPPQVAYPAFAEVRTIA